MAQGLQLGMRMGSEQAAQRFQQQQQALQEQRAAQQQAQWQAEFDLNAQQAARKYQAMQAYRKAVASGMDPMQALMEYGLEAGISGTAQAAAIRSQMQSQKQPWQPNPASLPKGYQYAQTGPNAYRILSTAEPQSGPVQGEPVLDPTTHQPIPGLVATPSPGGKGMTVHLVKSPSELSLTTAANLLEKLPELEASVPGITTNLAPVLQGRLNSLSKAAKQPPDAAPGGFSVKQVDGQAWAPKPGTLSIGDLSLPTGGGAGAPPMPTGAPQMPGQGMAPMPATLPQGLGQPQNFDLGSMTQQQAPVPQGMPAPAAAQMAPAPMPAPASLPPGLQQGQPMPSLWNLLQRMGAPAPGQAALQPPLQPPQAPPPEDDEEGTE